MSPSIPIPIGYELTAVLYENVAKAARAIVDVKQQHLSAPVRLWLLARSIRELLRRCEDLGAMAFAESESGKDWPADFRKLASEAEKLCVICRRAGFTNRSTTAASVDLIHYLAGEVMDLAERVELALDPRTSEHFKEARAEAETGTAVGFFSLSQ